ncbi:MAG TPA: WYL domain-containing protein [Longimicrobiales bacterium]|nr:WYL domain-containing protein [Longimicrobiales bacterium]
MVDGIQADARMERLLHVLPAASRKGGASLDELARALGTSMDRILEDLEEVTARVYYHPGGWPDDVSILVEADRVRVFHATGLERPVRLSSRETLCLALGLRGAAAAARLGDGSHRLALLRRAEEHLGAGAWSEEDAAPVHAEDLVPDPAGIRETLLRAARDRHPCAILYAKPKADDLDARVIHPYALAHAEGVWYVVGWCLVKEGMRVFRVDRILEAAGTDGRFDVPEDFDVAAYLTPTRVYRAEADVEVCVRYSPRIARWVRERAAAGMVGWEEEPDGSVVIRHHVADPHWVVGHALDYGPEAEILEPEELRALVREVVAGMAG